MPKPIDNTSANRPTGRWLMLGVAWAAVSLAALVWTGVLWPNRLAADRYAVRGVDVSAYQGEIDWPVLADQDLDFAFIKATEGSSHEDEQFAAARKALPRCIDGVSANAAIDGATLRLDIQGLPAAWRGKRFDFFGADGSNKPVPSRMQAS